LGIKPLELTVEQDEEVLEATLRAAVEIEKDSHLYSDATKSA